MERDKLNNVLSNRAQSPVPHLTPDPFLATRIEALGQDDKKRFKASGRLLNWSFASIIAACAFMIGIFIGSDLFINSTTDNDLFTDYSEAIYQTDFVDDWHTALGNGGDEQ